MFIGTQNPRDNVYVYGATTGIIIEKKNVTDFSALKCGNGTKQITLWHFCS